MPLRVGNLHVTRCHRRSHFGAVGKGDPVNLESKRFIENHFRLCKLVWRRPLLNVGNRDLGWLEPGRVDGQAHENRAKR